ncbi:KR domain-containing protein [Frankia sp. Cpl3]|nr:KR domain-containing protein [Frankia sp. Cpl3]
MSERLSAETPARADLSAVVHIAGVLDDGLIIPLIPDRLLTVLRPKVDAVLNLRAATARRPLSAFAVWLSTLPDTGLPETEVPATELPETDLSAPSGLTEIRSAQAPSFGAGLARSRRVALPLDVLA